MCNENGNGYRREEMRNANKCKVFVLHCALDNDDDAVMNMHMNYVRNNDDVQIEGGYNFNY